MTESQEQTPNNEQGYTSRMANSFATFFDKQEAAKARGEEYPPPQKHHVPVPIYLFMADPKDKVEQPPMDSLIELMKLSPAPDHVGAGTLRVQKRTSPKGKTYLVWTDNRNHKELGVAFLIKDEWQRNVLINEVPTLYPGYVLEEGMLSHINDELKPGRILVWAGEEVDGGEEA